MKPQIPFLDELRSELLTHAPDVSPAQGRIRSRPRQLRGPAMALATFVLVLVGGGLTWLVMTSGGESLDAVGAPDLIDWDIRITLLVPDDPEAWVGEIEAIPGVAETQYFPDASVLYPEFPRPFGSSGAAATTRPPDPDAPSTTEFELRAIAALFVRLDDESDAEDIAARLNEGDDPFRMVAYSPEIGARIADEFFAAAAGGATVIGEDPLVLQPQPGPEPQFDPSALGREIELEPAEPGDAIVVWIQQESGSSLLNDRFSRDETRPMLHIGRVADIDSHLIIYGAVENGILETVLEPNGSGTGGGDFTNSQFGITGGGSGGGGTKDSIGYVTAVVPPNAAVVTLTAEDGERLWQRPVAGRVMFPASIYDYATFIVEAYDTFGNEIGHWETTF